MTDIPNDEAKYRRLVSKVSLRMLRSSQWSDTRRQTWVRMYRLYRRIVDSAEGGDEYGIFLGMAFAVAEQINSKVTEPLLSMGVPFGVFPTQMGDGDKAAKFAQICRSFYAKPNVQDLLRKSKKEMIITGNRWEVDEWLHTERPGKMWGKVPKVVTVPLTRPDGTPVMGKDGQPATAQTTVMVDAEVDRKIVTHCGFNTRYPSVFNIYPEPDRPTIDTGQRTDMAWFCEDMGEMALEAMAREVYVDPTDKMTKPIYDFSRLLQDAGQRAKQRYEKILAGGDGIDDKYGPLIGPAREWSFSSDWGQQDKDSMYPSSGRVDGQSSEDRDKIWVVRHCEAGEILTIAQGKYIIHRKVNPWHTPGLKLRIENYTTDPEFIYGFGALEPSEDEFAEMNDIHGMSMDNFFRLVNKMVGVRVESIVSMDDFKRRAGGIIRLNESAMDARSAISDIPQNNVVGEMLGAESNIRGLIEFETSNLDGSPGVSGTKQNHKTARGMETIQINTQTRFITMQAQALINEARRGLSIQEMFNQFAFEKQAYRIVRDDGSTIYAQMNKDDIYTEGRPFEFAVELDATWGNTTAQRRDAQEVFDLAMQYEKLRSEMRDPEMKKANLSILFEDLLKKHGRRDLSKMFTMPDQSVSPDQELQILIQGGTTECRGDLMAHVQEHILQAQSPNLQKMIEAGKADKNTIRNLGLLIQQSLAKMNTFMRDPQGAALKQLNNAGMVHPGPQ